MDSASDTPVHRAIQVAPASPVIPKRVRACNYCRLKKIRCIGESPCANCVRAGETCFFAERQRRARRVTVDLANRLARFEDLLKSAHREGSSGNSSKTANSNTNNTLPAAYISDGGSLAIAATSDSPQQGPSTAQDLLPGNFLTPTSTQNSEPLWQEVIEDGDHVTEPLQQCDALSTSDPNVGDRTEGNEGTLWHHPNKIGVEYCGPRTSLSIFSSAGIAWVKEKVKDPDFQLITHCFAYNYTKRLKINRKLSSSREPEPPLEIALLYSKFHFEEATYAGLGILKQEIFEAKLRSHLGGAKAGSDDNPAWYALRNMVYASGCCLHVSRTGTYREAQQRSWAWFENALSVHTELLFCPTGLLGVQALSLMAYFVEGIGNPFLQYMLCSNALRLAIAQGLHRQPPASWKLSADEICMRNCTFWSIYCLEKDVACRTGRPSALVDDEISCQLPKNFPASNSANLTFLKSLISISQLSSAVTKRLSSVTAYRQTPGEWINSVDHLERKRIKVMQDLKDCIGCELPMDLARPPSSLSRPQALTVQFLFYALTWDINTALAHPWMRRAFGIDDMPEFQAQILQSSEIVARTSRGAILDCRHIIIDASCLMLHATYIPTYAAINVFTSILQDTSAKSVQSNLTLLDVAAGHFARLELATESQHTISLVKDFSVLARNAVKGYNDNGSQVQGLSQHVVDVDALEPLSVPESSGDQVEEPTRKLTHFINTENSGMPLFNPNVDQDFAMWDMFYPTWTGDQSWAGGEGGESYSQ